MGKEVPERRFPDPEHLPDQDLRNLNTKPSRRETKQL
jgi:hypothetical protein